MNAPLTKQGVAEGIPATGVRRWGHEPDGNLFVIGMKSYGRAPTFLMLTGYEQARSVVAAIAGDWDAARRVELVLPEAGVSSLDRSPEATGAGCCGSTAVEPVPVVGLSLSRTLRQYRDRVTLHSRSNQQRKL